MDVNAELSKDTTTPNQVIDKGQTDAVDTKSPAELLFKDTEQQTQQTQQKEEAKEQPPEQKDKQEFVLEKSEESILSDDDFNALANTLKEAGLSKEEATKIIGKQEEVLNNYIKTQESSWWEQVETWEDQLREDKDFGGQKFDENVQRAKKVFGKYADTETQKLFTERGYGNYPGLVKMFAKIERDMGNDSFVIGKASTRELTLAEKLYGKD